jgi:hypothetical protein
MLVSNGFLFWVDSPLKRAALLDRRRSPILGGEVFWLLGLEGVLALDARRSILDVDASLDEEVRLAGW